MRNDENSKNLLRTKIMRALDVEDRYECVPVPEPFNEWN